MWNRLRRTRFLDSLRAPGLIPATSIVATVSRTDRSFQLTSEPMRFPPLEVIGSSPRSPLKTIHWIVFRAFRTPEPMRFPPRVVIGSSPTGSPQSFAHWIVFRAFRTPEPMRFLPATSMVMAPHWGDHSLSVDLSPVEISATGGRQGFAPLPLDTLMGFDSTTASGGNFVESNLSRNERAPQCGVATIEAADI